MHARPAAFRICMLACHERWDLSILSPTCAAKPRHPLRSFQDNDQLRTQIANQSLSRADVNR